MWQSQRLRVVHRYNDDYARILTDVIITLMLAIIAQFTTIDTTLRVSTLMMN